MMGDKSWFTIIESVNKSPETNIRQSNWIVSSRMGCAIVLKYFNHYPLYSIFEKFRWQYVPTYFLFIFGPFTYKSTYQNWYGKGPSILTLRKSPHESHTNPSPSPNNRRAAWRKSSGSSRHFSRSRRPWTQKWNPLKPAQGVFFSFVKRRILLTIVEVFFCGVKTSKQMFFLFNWLIFQMIF